MLLKLKLINVDVTQNERNMSFLGENKKRCVFAILLKFKNALFFEGYTGVNLKKVLFSLIYQEKVSQDQIQASSNDFFLSNFILKY